MQETLKLRKFVLNDLQSVVRINRICLPENYSDYFFIDLHRRFPNTFIVAEEDGKIIGYAMCRMELGLSNFGFGGIIRKGHIVSVAVLPEYRRRGVGESLVTRAMAGMRLYKAKQCFLEVRITNTAAISLYTKLGYEVTRTIHGYYADGQDAHVMSRKLQ